MLKGLALTPPVIGRISIGKVVERNGRILPEKDDEFTITSQVQTKTGWVAHPLDDKLRPTPETKLRNIPVRVLFDDPELNLRVSYSMFDRQTGRPLCVGNGETSKRSTSSGMQSLSCPTPQACEIGQGGQCKPYGRLHVRVTGAAINGTAQKPESDGTRVIEAPAADVSPISGDELGSLVFRTTGYNSIRTLAARLAYFRAVSGGVLSNLPLELRLRGKSTTMSHRSPIYYVDLVVQGDMNLAQAITQAKREREERLQAGWDQEALDQAARKGYAAGAFEESEEEGVAVVQEFYPASDGDGTTATGESQPASLRQKLDRKLQGAAG